MVVLTNYNILTSYNICKLLPKYIKCSADISKPTNSEGRSKT